MSERVSVSQTEASPAALSRQERRQIRRVGVALQARLRNAEIEDGDFEEIRTTLNASRKAIYFFTPLNGYYKGMKLRVTFPFDAQASSNLEQAGEVIRVHRRGTGFGVAVALSTENNAEKPSTYAQTPIIPFTPQQGSAPMVERRCAKRSSFVAPVELTDVRGGTRIKARLADLSLHGCYVDTLNPLPVGSAVRVCIQRASERLEVAATVSSQHPGSGMGLEFSEISAEQRTTLKGWLSETAGGSESELIRPRSKSKPKGAADEDQVYAVRLINVLVRKGILSKSEATQLLQDEPEL